MDPLVQLFQFVVQNRKRLKRWLESHKEYLLRAPAVKRAEEAMAVALESLDPEDSFLNRSWCDDLGLANVEYVNAHLERIDALFAIFEGINVMARQPVEMQLLRMHVPQLIKLSWLPGGQLRRRYVRQIVTGRLLALTGERFENLPDHDLTLPQVRTTFEHNYVFQVQMRMRHFTDTLNFQVGDGDIRVGDAFAELNSFWEVVELSIRRNMHFAGVRLPVQQGERVW